MSVIWGKDERRYFAKDHRVFDMKRINEGGQFIAHAVSNTIAKRIANALNIYKVRPRKRAEKASKSSSSSSEKKG